MRSDVLVKLELLDNKHVQDIVHQVLNDNIDHDSDNDSLIVAETDPEPDTVSSRLSQVV